MNLNLLIAAITRDVRALQTWSSLPDPSRPPSAAGQPRTHTRTGTRDVNTAEPVETRECPSQSSHPPFVNFVLCFPRVAHGNRTQPNVAKQTGGDKWR